MAPQRSQQQQQQQQTQRNDGQSEAGPSRPTSNDNASQPGQHDQHGQPVLAFLPIYHAGQPGLTQYGQPLFIAFPPPLPPSTSQHPPSSLPQQQPQSQEWQRPYQLVHVVSAQASTGQGASNPNSHPPAHEWHQIQHPQNALPACPVPQPAGPSTVRLLNPQNQQQGGSQLQQQSQPIVGLPGVAGATPYASGSDATPKSYNAFFEQIEAEKGQRRGGGSMAGTSNGHGQLVHDTGASHGVGESGHALELATPAPPPPIGGVQQRDFNVEVNAPAAQHPFISKSLDGMQCCFRANNGEAVDPANLKRKRGSDTVLTPPAMKMPRTTENVRAVSDETPGLSELDYGKREFFEDVTVEGRQKMKCLLCNSTYLRNYHRTHCTKVKSHKMAVERWENGKTRTQETSTPAAAGSSRQTVATPADSAEETAHAMPVVSAPSSESSTAIPPSRPPPATGPAEPTPGNDEFSLSSKWKGKGKALEEEPEADSSTEDMDWSDGVESYDLQLTRDGAFAAVTAAGLQVGVTIPSLPAGEAREEEIHDSTRTEKPEQVEAANVESVALRDATEEILNTASSTWTRRGSSGGGRMEDAENKENQAQTADEETDQCEWDMWCNFPEDE